MAPPSRYRYPMPIRVYGDAMDCKILDFVSKRNEKIQQKRRSFERAFFQDFLGTYAILDQGGLSLPITLVDISPKGCLFRVPWKCRYRKMFRRGEEINLRIYFTKDAYIAVAANIRHGRKSTDPVNPASMYYGCAFDTSLPSFKAMEKFIEFLYSFAEHSSLERSETKSAGL